MINWFKKEEEAPFDDDQFQIGLEMGVLAGETRAANIIRNFDMPEEYKEALIEIIENDEELDDE
jgi:hypothetical protein